MNSPKKTQRDVAAMLAARYTLLRAHSRDEARVERAIIGAAAKVGYRAVLWDCATGTSTLNDKGEIVALDSEARDLGAVLDAVAADIARARERAAHGLSPDAALRRAWILLDVPPHLAGRPDYVRRLKSLARELEDVPGTGSIVLLDNSEALPPELAGRVTELEWPLPDREEIGAILDDVIGVRTALGGADAGAAVCPNGTRERAIEAASGLDALAVANSFAASLARTGKIDVGLIADEKRRAVKAKGLEWIDPDPRGLDAIGGLNRLKAWLRQRKGALSKAARDFGLPPPRGLFLLGVQGAGKSLTAKAVATAWGLPLLKMDLGAMKGSLVGQSEASIRDALATATAAAPCVLWCDEIEKSIGNAAGDLSGTSSDQLGQILTFMQERDPAAPPVFVIMTANSVGGLPPELLRKGRFDELFFVDLPDFGARVEILEITLRRVNRDPATIDCAAVATASDQFTGSELAFLVEEGLVTAFGDGARPLRTDDLMGAAHDMVPLAKTAEESIKALRDWARGRCRMASVSEEAPAAVTPRGGRSAGIAPVLVDDELFAAPSGKKNLN